MAEIVNLNKMRKAKAHAKDESRAQANRVKYGRTKVQKENDRRAEERRAQSHRGKEFETDEK